MMKTEQATIQPGQVNLGFKELTAKDVKRILTELSSRSPPREHRPRKCRRLEGVALIMNQIHAMPRPTHLKCLSFAGNPIGDAAMDHIRMIPDTVTDLNLADCRLSPKGVTSLAEYLKTNKSVTQLKLGGNNAGLEGARALAEMLQVNKNLRALSIRNCKIGPGGFAFIGMGILNNDSLKELDISRQKDFSVEGDEYLQSFGEMATMITPNGDFCVLTLAVCLNPRQSLEKIDVSDLGATDRTADALAKYMKDNESLQEIELGVKKSVSLDYGKPWSLVCHRLAENRLKRNLVNKVGASDREWMDNLIEYSSHEMGLHGLYFILTNKPDLCRRQRVA